MSAKFLKEGYQYHKLRGLTTGTYFCNKNGLLPLNFGYVAKMETLTLSPFFQEILTDKIIGMVAYRNSMQ